MSTVGFTEFVLPNGAQRHREVDVSDADFARAETLLRAGCRFEIEQLTTGEWSLEVVGDDDDDEPNRLALLVVHAECD